MIAVPVISTVLAALVIYIQLLIAVVVILIAASNVVHNSGMLVSLMGLIAPAVFPCSAHALISFHCVFGMFATCQPIAAIITHATMYVGWPNGWAVFRLAKDIWNEEVPSATDKERYQNTIFFPIGEPNPYGDYFVGQSYLAPLSTTQVPVFNVTFEPACRNNWHIHHAKSGGGQMLICVGGRGYYQELGKDPRELTPGTVINIPAEVKHWHGAAPDSWFSHLAVEVDGVETSNEWLEPVSDEEYNNLK